ncbi:hypothetical protein N1851_022728 [Merluccius polli]|uniref:Uncharacterized protein n=1 Tax=Merluccius polli TaxID=89951 RepID=A0AA47NVL1_MERPO|nr:hypothetical protein N1851_022728 [Merluccius polli]
MTWRVILLEVAIRRWVHCGHKGMDMVSNNTQIQKTSNDKDDHGPSGNKVSAASATQQQAISTAFLSSSKYKTESKEQQTKEQAIARWIGRIGLPLTTIEDEDFVQMMKI